MRTHVIKNKNDSFEEKEEAVEDTLKEAAPASKIVEPIAPQEPKKYRVLEERKVVYTGTLFLMKQGKVLDDAQYNIKELEAQGIKLEEVK